MSVLKVSGARLYYGRHGRGPVMLLVPGSSGSAGRGESRGYPCYEVALQLAKTLGLDLIELSGGHVGVPRS